TNAATQIEWGLDYMKDRYGSTCDAWTFWQSNGWY
ncbi:lytic transglycosylase domain-containing protein, partial [Streptomyces sp. ME01-18h]|nr:lytic transglycosylase domain-containing protein [Streptomyces sp. ME01-18h]